jgi:hypothetical protein
MIRYTLNCDHGHTFESWFQNSVAYDKQARRKLIACPECDSTKVEKAIMAPRLGRMDAAEASRTKLPRRAPPAPAQGPVEGPMQAPAQAPLAVMSPPERELRKKLKELREHITKNADYVGPRFPEQARKIHYGEIEHRSIYGEASPEEAKELHEEGIDFHPLPILPDEFN